MCEEITMWSTVVVAMLVLFCVVQTSLAIEDNQSFTQSWNGAVPSDDLLSIVAGTIENPDIVWSPRIPHIGEEITLSARVRGKGAGKAVSVRFTLEAADIKKIVLDAKPDAKQKGAGKFMDYEAKWKPKETGFYTFTVQIDPDNKSGDSFVRNNTASATIPVTWTELHIIGWGDSRHCRWVGTATYCPTPEDIPYWRRRGSKPLGFISHRQQNFVKLSQEELTKSILNSAKQISEAGYDGFLIDELGSYPTEESMAYVYRIGNAFMAVKKNYPKLRAYNWTGGGLLPTEAAWARAAGHILMTEAYPDLITNVFGTHSFEKRLENRIQVARNTDALFNHAQQACMIVALGVGPDCGVPLRPHIENWVRWCRLLGPEAPGICFYAMQPEQYDFYDEMTVKYFLKPVIMVKATDVFLSDYDLKVGKNVDVTARIRNIGGVRARNVKVRIYTRNLADGKRTSIHETTVGEIRNGILEIEEENPPSKVIRKINGIEYPSMHYGPGKWTKVFVDRALVTFPWTPKRSGYHAIEVEVQPSPQYTVLQGYQKLVFPVGE